MTKSVTVDAPAKLNLTLDVYPPRPDGFHHLDSIVVKISPADTLTVSVSENDAPGIRFTCDAPDLPTDDNNLVVRSARSLLAAIDRPVSVVIHLAKRLPAQAGLGGGSSDAASTLIALGRLLDVPASTIETIAATIGSDVPLFLTRGMIRMQGRGEAISPLPYNLRLHGVLVRPDSGVPTGDAYRMLDNIAGRCPGSATPLLLDVLARSGSLEDLAATMHNDFQEPVFNKYPDIAAAAALLQEAGALRTLLCGSGSALFGLTASDARAEHIADALRGRLPFVVQTKAWHE